MVSAITLYKAELGSSPRARRPSRRTCSSDGLVCFTVLLSYRLHLQLPHEARHIDVEGLEAAEQELLEAGIFRALLDRTPVQGLYHILHHLIIAGLAEWPV